MDVRSPDAWPGDLPADLVALCLLLPSFDRAILDGVGGFDGPAIDGLLASALVQPVAERDYFAVSPDEQRALRRQLRLTRPRFEIASQARLLEYFLQSLAHQPGQARAAAELRVFYHLGQLFGLLFARQEWQLFSTYVDAVAAAGPELARHHRLLDLYRGFVDIRTGAFERGAFVLQRVLDDGDLEHEIRLNALLGLGQMSRFQTHYTRALEAFAQMQAAALGAGFVVYAAVAMLNTASIFNELEDYERALGLALESLAIFEAHDDYERTAFARYIVALNAAYLGRYAFAEEHLLRAVALFEALAMEAPLAAAYWLRGYLNLLLGDAADSEVAYRQAIVRADTEGRGDMLPALDSWLDLGFLYLTLGQYDETLGCCTRALVLANRLGHEQRLGLIHALRGRALRALDRGEAALGAYREALACIEKLRDAQADDDLKISVLGTAQQVYEQAVLLCLELGHPAEAFAMAERARARAFLDLLARRSPELFTSHTELVAGADEVCAALPAGALLLAYYTTGVLPPGEHLLHGLKQSNPTLFAHLMPPASTVVFALTQDAVVARTLNLDPNLLRPADGELRPARRWLQAPRLRALHRELIAPLAGMIAGRDQLLIIPHGPLHHVPWLALQAPDGTYLLDAGGPAISRAPSATVLARSCLARPQGRGVGLLAVGYNDPAAGLRQAEAEAHSIARACGGTALIGSGPKAAGLPAAAAPVRYLHLAGHAVYRPDDPLASAVVIAAGEELSARAVMAGFSLRADLVSLSACTSGLSQVVPGDELLGMLRAWLSAGAATVVCALWEAADIVARLVMERFYEQLQAHGQPGPAFRDAIVAVRNLSGRELEPIFERWRAEQDAGGAGALPVLSPQDYDTQPYADPAVWGTFMLIGRP